MIHQFLGPSFCLFTPFFETKCLLFHTPFETKILPFHTPFKTKFFSFTPPKKMYMVRTKTVPPNTNKKNNAFLSLTCRLRRRKKSFFLELGKGNTCYKLGIFFCPSDLASDKESCPNFSFRKCVFLLLFKVIFLQMSTSTKKLLLFLTSSSALWYFFGSDSFPDVESGKKKDLLWFRDSFFLVGNSRCARRRRLNLSFFLCPAGSHSQPCRQKNRFLFLFYFCVYSIAPCMGNGCAFYCPAKRRLHLSKKGGDGPVSHARM